MKKILLLCSTIAISSTILSMQNENTDAKNLLAQKYTELVKANFKPTTKAFLESHPEATESQIIQRYIKEFVKNAIAYRKENLPLNTIGNEFRAALDYTPTDGQRLDYILTGNEPQRGMGCLASICSGAWKKELQKIEAKIAEQK